MCERETGEELADEGVSVMRDGTRKVMTFITFNKVSSARALTVYLLNYNIFQVELASSLHLERLRHMQVDMITSDLESSQGCAPA